MLRFRWLWLLYWSTRLLKVCLINNLLTVTDRTKECISATLKSVRIIASHIHIECICRRCIKLLLEEIIIIFSLRDTLNILFIKTFNLIRRDTHTCNNEANTFFLMDIILNMDKQIQRICITITENLERPINEALSTLIYF